LGHLNAGETVHDVVLCLHYSSIGYLIFQGSAFLKASSLETKCKTASCLNIWKYQTL